MPEWSPRGDGQGDATKSLPPEYMGRLSGRYSNLSADSRVDVGEAQASKNKAQEKGTEASDASSTAHTVPVLATQPSSASSISAHTGPVKRASAANKTSPRAQDAPARSAYGARPATATTSHAKERLDALARSGTATAGISLDSADRGAAAPAMLRTVTLELPVGDPARRVEGWGQRTRDGSSVGQPVGMLGGLSGVGLGVNAGLGGVASADGADGGEVVSNERALVGRKMTRPGPAAPLRRPVGSTQRLSGDMRTLQSPLSAGNSGGSRVEDASVELEQLPIPEHDDSATAELLARARASIAARMSTTPFTITAPTLPTGTPASQLQSQPKVVERSDWQPALHVPATGATMGPPLVIHSLSSTGHGRAVVESGEKEKPSQAAVLARALGKFRPQ